MPYYDPESVAQGVSDLAALSADTRPVLTYGDLHLASLGDGAGGLIFNRFLSSHTESVAKFEDLVVGTSKLLGNAGTHLQKTMTEYSNGEQANLDAIKDLWAALERTEELQPIGPPPDGVVSPGPMPSSVLVAPINHFEDWIWDVYNWPSYLPGTGLIRTIFEWLFQAFTGSDPWIWLMEWLSGDFEHIALAADTWGNLARYFAELPEGVHVRMANMFHGWYDSAAADAAGGYFAEVAAALGSVEDPLTSLSSLYTHVAGSSYSFFQAIYGFFDAAMDALIAAAFGASGILELLATPFTAGSSFVAGVISLIVAIIAAVAALWDRVFSVAYQIMSIVAFIGAALTTVDWVTLPEG